MKKSFVIYCDWISAFDRLTDEQLGQAIRCAMNYANGKESQCSDPLADLLFSGIMKPTFERDSAKYDEVCARRKESVEKRWSKQNSNEIEDSEAGRELKKMLSGLKDELRKDIQKE